MQPGPRSAEIWLADVDVGGRELDDLGERFSLLPEADGVRLAAILDPLAQQRWRRSRLVLRLLLAMHLGVERARAAFAVSRSGRPRVAGASELDFSLSHSGPLALIGITPAGRIGVDVETRTAIEMDDRRRAVIEAAAMGLAPGMPLPRHGARRFIQAWTRLEALAKASGVGIGPLLVRLGIRGPAAGLRVADLGPATDLLVDHAGALRVEDLALDPPAVGAVALSRETPWTFRRFPDAVGDIIDVERLTASCG